MVKYCNLIRRTTLIVPFTSNIMSFFLLCNSIKMHENWIWNNNKNKKNLTKVWHFIITLFIQIKSKTTSLGICIQGNCKTDRGEQEVEGGAPTQERGLPGCQEPQQDQADEEA